MIMCPGLSPSLIYSFFQVRAQDHSRPKSPGDDQGGRDTAMEKNQRSELKYLPEDQEPSLGL